MTKKSIPLDAETTERFRALHERLQQLSQEEDALRKGVKEIMEAAVPADCVPIHLDASYLDHGHVYVVYEDGEDEDIAETSSLLQ
jgi:hypothetical protein